MGSQGFSKAFRHAYPKYYCRLRLGVYALSEVNYYITVMVVVYGRTVWLSIMYFFLFDGRCVAIIKCCFSNRNKYAPLSSEADYKGFHFTPPVSLCRLDKNPQYRRYNQSCS